MVRPLKGLRKFNGKYYVRVLRTTNESVARHTKEKLKADGKYALIIHYSNIYQVYSRTRKKD